jgi:hypothetical protein
VEKLISSYTDKSDRYTINMVQIAGRVLKIEVLEGKTLRGVHEMSWEDQHKLIAGILFVEMNTPGFDFGDTVLELVNANSNT